MILDNFPTKRDSRSELIAEFELRQHAISSEANAHVAMRKGEIESRNFVTGIALQIILAK